MMETPVIEPTRLVGSRSPFTTQKRPCSLPTRTNQSLRRLREQTAERAQLYWTAGEPSTLSHECPSREVGLPTWEDRQEVLDKKIRRAAHLCSRPNVQPGFEQVDRDPMALQYNQPIVLWNAGCADTIQPRSATLRLHMYALLTVTPWSADPEALSRMDKR